MFGRAVPIGGRRRRTDGVRSCDGHGQPKRAIQATIYSLLPSLVCFRFCPGRSGAAEAGEGAPMLRVGWQAASGANLDGRAT